MINATEIGKGLFDFQPKNTLTSVTLKGFAVNRIKYLSINNAPDSFSFKLNCHKNPRHPHLLIDTNYYKSEWDGQ